MSGTSNTRAIRSSRENRARTYHVRLGQEGALTPIWDILLSDVNLIAGICAGAQGILFELLLTQGQKYYISTDANISNYRLLHEYRADFIPSASQGKITQGYGVWLRSYALYRYNLYHFSDSSFLQGIISICNYFQVDFRNYLYGLPFDANANLYTLNGYNLLPYSISQDIREDPYADEEDWDDENIIQPYNQSDDTITIKEVNSVAGLDDVNYENGLSFT